MAKAATLPETPSTPASSANGHENIPEKIPLPDPNDPNNQTINITFRGVTVTVPKRRGRWDIDALVDFQDSRPLPGLRKLIGPAQWQKIKRVCPLGDDLEEFSSIAADAINADCVA